MDKRPLSDIERRILRQAKTNATERFSISGGTKDRGYKPKPVTLPDPKNRYAPRDKA